MSEEGGDRSAIELALEAWRAVAAASSAIAATDGVDANEYATRVTAELARVYSLARRVKIEDEWWDEPYLEVDHPESDELRVAIAQLLGEHPFRGFGKDPLEDDLVELHAHLEALAQVPQDAVRRQPGSFLTAAYKLELCGHLGDHAVEVIRSLHFYLSGVWPAPDPPEAY